MKSTHTYKTALKALSAHASRTFLTVLGIVIGIAAIILVASIGEGAQNLILSQVESLGAKTIVVVPGREPEGPTDPAVVESFFGDSLKQRELDALSREANVSKIDTIMPAVFAVETISYERETFRPLVLGATEKVFDLFSVFPEFGTQFSNEDVRSKASVVVLGVDVKEELFGKEEAIGKRIRIKDGTYRVVGVLPPKGQVLFFNFDETVLVPYTVAQENIFGIKHFNRIIIQVEHEEDVPRTVADIEATLRELHNISDPEKDDFFVGTQAEIAATVETITGILTLFLASVAAIALVVGGVGIMNIMLVSVTERTREIGLRKAIGATKSNIRFQFLLEAVIITLSGGIIGVLFGVLLSYGASIFLTQILENEWAFVFPISAALIGIIVSTLVGLVFGFYPAYQASLKSPMDALRYE